MMNKTHLLKQLVFLLTFTTLIGCGDDSSEPEADRTQAELDSLSRELTIQQAKNDSLKSLMEQGNLAAGYPIYFGKAYDTIDHPERFIKQSLQDKPELIPLDPVMGGTMEFRQVQILTDEWVLAHYDDGHIQGTSIYQFELQPGGKLEFEHLAMAPRD